MEEIKDSEELEKNESINSIIKTISEEKDKIVLFLSLALGICIGSLSCAVYGSSAGWSGTVEIYCTDSFGTAVNITAVTLGFMILLFVCGAARMMRMLVYPAVCFRGMGLGTLICGIIQSSGYMGLCFAVLVTIPYAVINSALAVCAGEFALGMHRSFGQKNSELTKGLILHTIKIFAIYMLISVISCALFVISSKFFGKYLL